MYYRAQYPLLFLVALFCGEAVATAAPEKSPPELSRTMVLPGESFTDVARRVGASVEALCLVNDANVEVLQGDVLSVTPGAAAQPRRRVFIEVQPGDEIQLLASKYDLSPERIRWLNGIGEGLEPSVGDTLLMYAPVSHRREGIRANGKRFRSRVVEPTPFPPTPGVLLKAPEQAWGSRETIDVLLDVVDAVRTEFPEGPQLVFGDISRPWGGRFEPHLSHRLGNDIDIGLPLASGEAPHRFQRVNAKTMDIPRAWALIRSAIATGRVRYVFLDYRLQRTLYGVAKASGFSDEHLSELFEYPKGRGALRGLIRHARGHSDHIHIRFDHEERHASDALVSALGGEPPLSADVVQAQCRAFSNEWLWSELQSLISDRGPRATGGSGGAAAGR